MASKYRKRTRKTRRRKTVRRRGGAGMTSLLTQPGAFNPTSLTQGTYVSPYHKSANGTMGSGQQSGASGTSAMTGVTYGR